MTQAAEGLHGVSRQQLQAVLGLALHWHGADDDALATLTEAVRIANAGGNHLAAMHASGGLAAIHM